MYMCEDILSIISKYNKCWNNECDEIGLFEVSEKLSPFQNITNFLYMFLYLTRGFYCQSCFNESNDMCNKLTHRHKKDEEFHVTNIL